MADIVGQITKGQQGQTFGIYAQSWLYSMLQDPNFLMVFLLILTEGQINP